MYTIKYVWCGHEHFLRSDHLLTISIAAEALSKQLQREVSVWEGLNNLEVWNGGFIVLPLDPTLV